MDGGSYLKQQSEKQKKRKGKRKKEEKKYAPDSQGQFFLFAHEINYFQFSHRFETRGTFG